MLLQSLFLEYKKRRHCYFKIILKYLTSNAEVFVIKWYLMQPRYTLAAKAAQKDKFGLSWLTAASSLARGQGVLDSI